MILPGDSVPKEEDAKIVIRAYQRFYFAYPKHRSYSGATLIAGQRWIEKDDVDMKRRYEEMGYKFAYRSQSGDKYYDLYYYPIPKVDSLIVYVRSKEKYCTVRFVPELRSLNDKGEEIEWEGWGTRKAHIKEPGKWVRVAMYLYDLVYPNQSFQPIYGFTLFVTPPLGSIDSCASFEVGPIYLK